MGPKQQDKDKLTRAHQWLTIIAVPAGLAIAGWIGLKFDSMRTDLGTLSVTVQFVKAQGDHNTATLDEIQRYLYQRRDGNAPPQTQR